ncbi:MAG: glycosyltransferase [Hyphomicrobium sp.]|uniref:glycosyltransferase n=1 Tax=Hyphomicrobium sp. TaxID=82 RepID=UPI003D101C73
MTAETVVHYIDSNTYGGCERVVSLTLAGIDTRRWQPVLVHHEAPGIADFVSEIAREGVLCRTLPAMRSRGSMAMLGLLVRELAALKPAVFHAHLNWPLGCRHGLMAAKMSAVPAVVATSHLHSPIEGTRFSSAKQWVQQRAIDRYIAVSEEVKKRLLDELHVPEAKVRTVHNGMLLPDLPVPRNEELRKALAGGSDRPLVLTPARLHEQKGHRYLLEAAAHVPGALFLFAGEGPERQRLEAECRRLGLEDRVRFLGHRPDIPELLSLCDLFVLPSLYEGLPLSVLEAMSYAKPVVATAAGGTDEAVVDGVTGRLVPLRDPHALAQAMNSLLRDRETAARYGAAGRRRVEDAFSVPRMLRGVTGIYEELLAGRPQPARLAEGTHR